MQQKLVTRAEFSRMANVNPSTVTRLCDGSLHPSCIGDKIDINHENAKKYLAKRDVKLQEAPATGLDPRYEEAYEICKFHGQFNATLLMRELGISDYRARKLLKIMDVNGLIPNKPEPDFTPAKPKKKLVGAAVVKEEKKAAPPPPKKPSIPSEIEPYADMTLRDLILQFGTDTQFVDWLTAIQKIEAINEKRLKNAQIKGQLVALSLIEKFIDVYNSGHLRLLQDGAKSIAVGVLSKNETGVELAEIEDHVTELIGSFIKPIKSKAARVLKNGSN